jgi:hypothetical protein
VLGVARHERVSKRAVVTAVPQLPERHGDVVHAIPEPAVVEVDETGLAAREQRVLEVEVGMDEAERVGFGAELVHPPTDASDYLVEPVPELDGDQIPHPRGVDAAVLHGVAEERLLVPSDADEPLGQRPAVGVVVEPCHRTAEPAEVDGSRRFGVTAPVHPSQQRATSRLTSIGQLDGGHEPPVRCRLRLGNGEVGAGAERGQPVELGPDRGERVDTAAVTPGPVHPKEEPAGFERRAARPRHGQRRVDPERRVLAVGDEPQLWIDERVRLEGAEGEPSQRGDLPGDREHAVSLSPQPHPFCLLQTKAQAV